MQRKEVRVELALENEINVIQYIAYNTWPHTYGGILSKPQLDYMLGLFYSVEALNSQFADGHIFLLAWQGEDPIGFASIENDFLGKAATRIHKIYVLPASQGSGAGIALMKNIEERAGKYGSRFLSLNVNRHNIARHFYEKIGFAIAAEEDIELEHGYLMEDFVMEKPL